HVWPPSVERYTPLPRELGNTVPHGAPHGLPIAAYWLAKFVGSATSAVISPDIARVQFRPPSVDFKTPNSGGDGTGSPLRPATPSVVPRTSVFGSDGWT